MSGGGGKVSSENAYTRQQAAIAADQHETYKELYKPLERTAISTISGMNTAGAYERATSQAVSDTAATFDTARQQLQRAREERGMFSTLDDLDSLKLSIGEATAKSLAANRGRQGQHGMYLAALQNAVATGRGLQTDAAGNFSRLGAQQLQADQANANAKAQGQAGLGQLLGTAAMLALKI